jgi:hypothetical protein
MPSPLPQQSFPYSGSYGARPLPRLPLMVAYSNPSPSVYGAALPVASASSPYPQARAFVQSNRPGKTEQRRAVSSTPAWLLPAFVGSQVAMVGLTGLALWQSAKLRDMNQMTQNSLSVLTEVIEKQQGPQDYLNTLYQVVNGTVESGNEGLKPVADVMQKYKKTFTFEGVAKGLDNVNNMIEFWKHPVGWICAVLSIPNRLYKQFRPRP